MKNSWKIFKTDIQNISRNWVAAILIGGLVFLPSLYAWLNIYASWDPYSQTDQLPVAIVNEDAGATVRGEQLNVGNELIDTLKNNQDMKWSFTSRKIAMEKVEYGDYFAVIIIPKNFSEKLASVVSDNPQKADIEYYVNEKINSIAPKITEKGATFIVQKVSSQFISSVNGVIFDLFNDLGIEIEKDLPDIQNFEDYVFKMEQDLPEIHHLLTGAQKDASSAQKIITQATSMLPRAEQITTEGLSSIERTIDFLTKAQNRLNEVAPQVKNDLEKVSKISKSTNEFLQSVQNVPLDFTELDRVKADLDSKMTSNIQTVDAISKDLNWLKEVSNSSNESSEETNNEEQQTRLDNAIDKTNELKSFLQEAQTNTRTIDTLVKDKEQQFQTTLNDLQQIAQNTSVQLDAFMNEYKNNIEPTVLSEVAKAKKTLGNAKEMLTSIQSTLPEVASTLNSADAHIKEGKTTLDQALAQYPYINDKVNQLADRIRKVQGETNINEIIQLLRNDPQAERSFFEEPIVLNENKLFPIANYGTGMTPFYTVLAIWVGCLLLISLLATDANHERNVSERSVYFGRLFTFSAIGLLQALIVTIGDIVLLGVDVKDSLWFILFGFLISFVFMSIVYTLVSVFGDVGKALAIIMLVLQIAGAGGTYPVVLLPEFFQTINPALPFTYAVDLMREAVGGIVWPRVIRDVSFLLLFSLAFLLFGTFLKEKINRKTKLMLKKSRESGLFH
ncbi:YhgE/Pip domain-containing protein [Psychrobacillus lasiicapitis]|uniref:YhgE/Pip domain-containing protein n=1 Tax=Psychrobacillus lasiicapitis TaxID=1636719 RepID=A0A544SZV4_9BACI|nr:YhgE/Pip domain-containing protein [Psychrobacillus lasiicapitis]TQR10732.1 YhgE/Pip domain-containing protein [Psychrobacillus lasiicapitis]GGA42944.1 phage infection protein [Psychrobacillus lasiicapitis]